MSSTIPQAAIDQIAKTKGVLQSATALISTFKTKLQAAHDEALANGATKDELEPVQTAINDLAADTDALAQAVAANP
jgi:hypothetical protein